MIKHSEISGRKAFTKAIAALLDTLEAARDYTTGCDNKNLKRHRKLQVTLLGRIKKADIAIQKFITSRGV